MRNEWKDDIRCGNEYDDDQSCRHVIFFLRYIILVQYQDVIIEILCLQLVVTILVKNKAIYMFIDVIFCIRIGPKKKIQVI